MSILPSPKDVSNDISVTYHSDIGVDIEAKGKCINKNLSFPTDTYQQAFIRAYPKELKPVCNSHQLQESKNKLQSEEYGRSPRYVDEGHSS